MIRGARVLLIVATCGTFFGAVGAGASLTGSPATHTPGNAPRPALMASHPLPNPPGPDEPVPTPDQSGLENPCPPPNPPGRNGGFGDEWI
ncbi:hypothetical protein GCM10010140_26770 [Streptosporangium pseudovulgare]|uniref:Uncharacterized protein n=1 Tax=Streptosporangium pseudovulgare TaxID=35765 RepID=A0ABQ2QSH8_9ACTN|nr:hypothetical protein GCM10010140_26770 [Streptosporangium pseudovulgare]